MKKYCPIILLFLNLLSLSFLSAQNFSKNDILSIDNQIIKTDEFLWMFNKNSSLNKTDSEADLDQYLDLFISFKLKVKEALDQGLDGDAIIKRELRGYKSQLERNYLSDQTVSAAMLEEAYQRLQYDIKASHVLVRLEDSLLAKEQALRIGQLLIDLPLETVKERHHNGKTIFVENLGYFTAFNMDYDFETVAYNTPVGSISKPFKTKYGYHVLKVHDRLESDGEVQVAHILLADQPKDSIPSDQEIHMLYQKLHEGQDFSELAKRYSDDPQSAGKGGRLKYFRRGQLASEVFESESLKLDTIGEITSPFETQFGWHIVKLLDRKKFESFDMARADLENRIQRDGRARKINEAFFNKLARLYEIDYVNPKKNYLLRILDTSYFEQQWSPPADMPQDAVLFVLNGQKVFLTNFVNYLIDGKKRYDASWSINAVLDDAFNNFVNSKMYNKYQSELPERFPEFRLLLNEYRDGLLLFEVMQQNVWSKYPDSDMDVIVFQEGLEQNWVKSLKEKHNVQINTAGWAALKKEILNSEDK